MTIEELYNLYGTKYKFRKETGLSITTFDNWLKLGYIPIASQMKLEKLTHTGLRLLYLGWAGLFRESTLMERRQSP